MKRVKLTEVFRIKESNDDLVYRSAGFRSENHFMGEPQDLSEFLQNDGSMHDMAVKKLGDRIKKLNQNMHSDYDNEDSGINLELDALVMALHSQNRDKAVEIIEKLLKTKGPRPWDHVEN